MMYRRIRGFTLVELLVVVGIISLLISILLVALTKARQQANLVNCSSQLRQMGAALDIYCSENKGMLPWGTFARNATPDNAETLWSWPFTLSEIMNRNVLGSDGKVHKLSPVFRDRDTVSGLDNPNWVCHYTVNPKLLYCTQLSAPKSQRRITNVKHTSDVFVIWDAPQCADAADHYNAYLSADAMDEWAWYNDGLNIDNPAVLTPGLPIFPGKLGVAGNGTGAALQKQMNYDPPNAVDPNGWTSHFRFRHLNNKTLAAVCLDGHVETRNVGSVTRRDVYTNTPQMY
jgi:prepilin-type N-terminal cleavage/methylation domain-containing protein